jgi:pantothenate kinase
LETALSRCTGGKPPEERELEALDESICAQPLTRLLDGLGVDLRGRARERLEFLSRCAGLCPSVALDVAGFPVQARVSLLELWRVYLPLCQTALVLARRSQGVLARRSRGEGGRRVLVGVAGPGASGKSVFAAILREVVNAAQDEVSAAVCPLDGFHLPNAYLDGHWAQDGAGRRVRLRSLKGAPETFDAAAFAECLARLRSEPEVAMPRYDRRIHDPVPAGIRIGATDRVVVVEGNYLLLDRGAWAPVAAMLDLKLMLLAPLGAVRDLMVRRHMWGGRSREDALAHFERVDRPNYDLIAGTAGRADLVALRDARQQLRGVEAPPQPGRPAAGARV